MQIKKSPPTNAKRPPIKSKLYSGLKQLYHTHGALTFLLAFYPLLPNIIELHTKSYLGLTRRLTGSIHDIDEVIGLMFGKRGLKVYEAYKKNHPKQILPDQIFKMFFENNQPDQGLKLMQAMFFDRAQRSFEHADKMRAAVILASPEILRQLPIDDLTNRDRFIRLITNQAIIDQAIPSQLAFIEIALRLLTQKERYELNLEKDQLNRMFAAIELKIKAELAGNASVFTAPPKTYHPKKKDPILITTQQAASLLEVLLLLAISPALEVKKDAKAAILELEDLKKKRR